MCRGVKEKDLNDVNNKEVKDGAVTVASRNTQEENVGQSSTGPTTSESGPDVSFASLLNGESKRKGLNFHTLITQAGNGANVAIWLESIRVVSERYANSDCGFFLGKRVAYPVVANYVRNTWGKYDIVKSMFNSSTGLFFFQFSSMDGLDSVLENEDVVNVPVWVKLHDVPVTVFTKDGLSAISTNIGRADVELKDTIVVAMPKLTGEGFYTCIVRVEYEWKPPRFACCKVPKGAPVGSKVGFKPTKEYRPVAKNPTVNTNSNKNKGVGYQWEALNLASSRANSSGTSFLNVEMSSPSTTPIVDKIGKLEKLIIEGKVTLVDDNSKPLKKFDYPEDHDSDDENGDYDEDQYDDDMYEDRDLPDKLQDICDNLDIRVRGFQHFSGFRFLREKDQFYEASSSVNGEKAVEQDLVTNKNVLNILKKWSPNAILTKEDLPKMHVWVKLHNVPMVALSSGRLSRGSFTRALIEFDATCWLKDRLVVVPKLEGLGYIMETIHVEYEYKLPRCEDSNGNSMNDFIEDKIKKVEVLVTHKDSSLKGMIRRDLLLFPWPDLELHLSGEEFFSMGGYGGSNARWKDVEGVRLQRGDKTILVAKGGDGGAWLLAWDMVVMSWWC
ncbi:putative ribonuclease H-like domain-containing protein [Tanacetum coccineum]